jgi:hypothetical protein
MKTMPAGMVLLFRNEAYIQIGVFVDPGDLSGIVVLPDIKDIREVR